MSFVSSMLLGTMPSAQKPNPELRRRVRAPTDKSTVKALAKYAEVMGDEWVKSMEIGRRLGVQNGSLQATLRRWYAKGLVDRREADKGYEWKVLK